MTFATLRRKLGCWLHERRQAESVLRSRGRGDGEGLSWLDLCNRHERISRDERSAGRICHWTDSSPLTVARIFPGVGGRILQACLRDWPVDLSSQAELRTTSDPEISVILGVRGTRRLPQFRTVIASLLNQRGVTTEIIVVEQSIEREFESIVPPGVRYLHTPLPHPQTPFNRSWGLNAGARVARGRVVVLHDADMVVPADFAAAIGRVVRDGIQALRLPRLIFYLDKQTSERVQATGSLASVSHVERIVQNNPTPMAVDRESYFRIGGHDESFYGWGGEDNEFLDRVRTLALCEGAFLPVWHLWHEEAPNRSGDRNAAHLRARLMTPAVERIRIQSGLDIGRNVPSVEWRPAAERVNS